MELKKNRYPVPMAEARAEIMVMNSRFITSLAPASTVDQAQSFIKRIRAEFPDASHHVPAFLVGFGESVTAHCSDAGEPSGTAGRPALAVLQGSGLGDVVVVVTRYFGGTKLGTGGLVRAYSDAVRAVLEVTRRGWKVPTQTLMMEFPYTFLERVRRLAASLQGQVLDEDFTATVMLTVRFPVEKVALFQAGLAELTNGSTRTEIIETSEVLMEEKR
ncbi:MAG TPA: YigZ family protein [Anaerolineaceae bacterium]